MGIIIIVGVAGGLYFTGRIRDYEAYVEKIEINELNLENIEDGTYYGESDAAGVVSVEVEVVIENHAIADLILVKHHNGRGDDANVMIDRVMEAQSLSVDTVSGATNSSVIILDAIDNALDD